MKYKTVIEVVCDASDREDALNTAGEYLTGNFVSGVMLRTKTASLRDTLLMRYAFTGVIILILASICMFKG